MTPPPARPDFHNWDLSAASAAAHSAKKNGVHTAVLVSSVGAHTGRGTGPVGSLLALENEFQRLLPNVVSLRAGFFMENLLRDLAGIAGGTIYAPLPAEKPFPMVACRDVAHKAAAYLISDNWRGHKIVGVHGPRDLSQKQVAAELSKSLGRTIHYQ